MGKGNKGKNEVAVKLLNCEESPDTSQRTNHFEKYDTFHHKCGNSESDVTQTTIPPGIPECDVILKGSTRFWYLESALFLFGVVGVIFSAMMLIWHYINSSSYF